MGARYYAGAAGKFLSEDPVFLDVGNPMLEKRINMKLWEYLSDPQGMNSYAYANNNPLKYIDPQGEYWVLPKYRASLDINNNKSNIINAANQFKDVNPEIVAGVIYQERYNNVNPFDLADTPGGRMGINMSVGLGQVKISTAKFLMEKGYVKGLDNYTFSRNGKDITNTLSESAKITTLFVKYPFY